MFGKSVVVGLAATALVMTSGEPAFAMQRFPGSGYGVTGASSMTSTFHIPQASCSRGENSATIFGLISPAIGTLDGWNAAATIGCVTGHPWYRIQVWDNSPTNNGWSVDPAMAGDLVQARVQYAKSGRPLISVTNQTRQRRVQYRLKRPVNVIDAGSYGGSRIVKFANTNLTVWADGKPLSKLRKSRRVMTRNGVELVHPSWAWGDGSRYTLFFMHH